MNFIEGIFEVAGLIVSLPIGLRLTIGLYENFVNRGWFKVQNHDNYDTRQG